MQVEGRLLPLAVLPLIWGKGANGVREQGSLWQLPPTFPVYSSGYACSGQAAGAQARETETEGLTREGRREKKKDKLQNQGELALEMSKAPDCLLRMFSQAFQWLRCF